MEPCRSVALSLLVLLSSFGLANAAPPPGQVFDCKMTTHSRGGWVSPRIVVAIIPEHGVANVMDSFINYRFRVPIPATLADRKSHYRLTWIVPDLPTKETGPIKVRFSASLRPKSGRLSVTADVGDDNHHTGSGRCTLIKTQ